jgi:hypothetical protein
MKRYTFAALLTLLPGLALAASPDEPVKRIMDITAARWASDAAEAPDYFDALDRDFNATFAAAYREAAKHPAYDDADSGPFDYDVITSSQDGCPLKDIKIAAGAEKAGVTEVTASFKLWSCAPDAETQGQVSEVKFDVVTENGKPVISDIHRLSEGKWDSLVEEMKVIANPAPAEQ